jgi:hypothetical protein
MSLIKSVDVPKHRADRLRSRGIAARLSGGAAKQPASGAVMGAKDPLVSSPTDTPIAPIETTTT